MLIHHPMTILRVFYDWVLVLLKIQSCRDTTPLHTGARCEHSALEAEDDADFGHSAPQLSFLDDE